MLRAVHLSKLFVSILLSGALMWGVWLSVQPVQRAAAAPHATPTLNGAIAAGEYGSHVDGQNQQTSGGSIAYVTWDATNFYIAYANANVNEGVVVYIDTNPVVPANGGSNAAGNVTGQNYDGTNFAALPFRADFVAYFKTGYREYRTADGAGGWSGPTAGFGTYADDSATTRELAIPWSALGGQPARFNFLAYATSAGGFVYGQLPAANAGGLIGTGATYAHYYLVGSTASLPFSAPQTLFAVNTATDELNSDGDCSLREAIQAANTNVAVDLCPAGNGTDTIALASGYYTITLSGAEDANVSGDFDVTSTLTIIGAGQASTLIDGNNLDRVFHTPNNVPLTLQNLTVQNGTPGSGGGAILTNGALTLTAVSLINNRGTDAGALYALNTTRLDTVLIANNRCTNGGCNSGGARFQSTAVITGAQFISNATANGNAGGAWFIGAATITNTDFVSNTSTQGGGAQFQSPTIIYNTRFVSNTTKTGAGGGVFAASTLNLINTVFLTNTAGAGGGAYLSSGGQIVNSLFARNRASANTGDGVYIGGNATLLHLTVVSPTLAGGSGIYVAAGTVNITNTLVASQTTGLQQAGGTVTAWHTLFYNNTADTVGAVTNNTPVSGDPHFAAPANDNYHLGAESAAVDAGLGVGVTTDFDGEARPQGLGYDIGYDEVVQQCGLSPNTNYTFSNPAATVSFSNLGDINCLAGVYMPRVHLNHTATVGQDHFWQIAARTNTGAAATGFTAAITLPHSGLANPIICFYPGLLGGAGWDCTGTQTYDGSTITRQGVTHFSEWAVGDNTDPTAITLNTLQATPADRSSAAYGPIGLAVIAAFSGAAILIKRKRTISA